MSWPSLPSALWKCNRNSGCRCLYNSLPEFFGQLLYTQLHPSLGFRSWWSQWISDSLSLLMMKVMVWYSVKNSHEIMTVHDCSRGGKPCGDWVVRCVDQMGIGSNWCYQLIPSCWQVLDFWPLWAEQCIADDWDLLFQGIAAEASSFTK
jgi:hypothetical protein